MIYLASSWRHPAHDAILSVLRAASLKVFNYRETNASFHWNEISPNWQHWACWDYLPALNHCKANKAFANDMAGLKESNTVVLLAPSGISAHLELGYAVGAGKKTAIFHNDVKSPTPELMSKMVDFQTYSLMELLDWLGVKD